MRRLIRVLVAVLLPVIGITSYVAWGQSLAQNLRMGLVDDWSAHHLIFSNPGTLGEAQAQGRFPEWYRAVGDPRYIMQQGKRSSGAKPVVDANGHTVAVSEDRIVRKRGVSKDWQAALQTGTVQPNMYPAEYGASLTTASCTGDFVIYPTGVLGTTTAANIIAYSNLYSGCGGAVPSVYWAYNTSGGMITNSPIMYTDGVQSAFIQVTGTTASLVVLKGSATGGAFTGTTVNTSKTVTFSTGSCSLVLPGEPISGPGIPAGDTIASCSTTITLTTAANATNATAQPLAYNNQFQGTTHGTTSVTVPSGTCTPAIVGSAIYGTGIPSGDKVATCTTTTLTLTTAATNSATETISFNPATVSGPVTLTANTPAAYRACVAPCMTSFTLNGSPNDTYSAPFYDFASDDALYVGDDGGKLHKFTGIFAGTPAETTTGWPVTLNASFKTTSPVYDPASGHVFVGNTGAFLYEVTTSGTATASADLGDVIIDAPLIDSSAERVYVFVTTNSGGDNAVFQFTPGFAAGTHGNGATAGTTVATGGTGFYLYDGTFDNVYYSSSVHTGTLWVAGNTGVIGGATLYRIPITANALGATSTPVVTGLNDSHYAWYSPLTEFCNNGTSACTASTTQTTAGKDYLFFSVDHAEDSIVVSGTTTATTCSPHSGNGCVFSFNISNPATLTLGGSVNVLNVGYEGDGLNGCFPTGAFVIDNSGTATGASQIYYMGLNGNTAGGPTGGRTVVGNLKTTAEHVTLTTGTFTAADVGSQISDNTQTSGTPIIGGGVTIASVQSGMTATLSTAPTTTITAQTLSIVGLPTSTLCEWANAGATTQATQASQAAP